MSHLKVYSTWEKLCVYQHKNRRKLSRHRDFILNGRLPVTSLPLENKVELGSTEGGSRSPTETELEERPEGMKVV